MNAGQTLRVLLSIQCACESFLPSEWDSSSLDADAENGDERSFLLARRL